MPQQFEDSVVMDGLVKVPEAAKFLALSRSKLYALMEAGRLPYAKIDGARRIPRRSLVEFATSTLRGGAADAENANEVTAV